MGTNTNWVTRSHVKMREPRRRQSMAVEISASRAALPESSGPAAVVRQGPEVPSDAVRGAPLELSPCGRREREFPQTTGINMMLRMTLYI